MSTLAICLYSKYSQRCKEFIEEMGDDLDIQMVSIDNRKVRDMLLKDNQGYHIKTVPCVFLFFPNGRLEKYEGSDAFVWLRKVKEALEDSEPNTKTVSAPMEINQPTPVLQEEETPPRVSVEQMKDREASMREMGSEQIITKKTENIKELAQMMQQQREQEEENNPKPLSPPLPMERP